MAGDGWYSRVTLHQTSSRQQDNWAEWRRNVRNRYLGDLELVRQSIKGHLLVIDVEDSALTVRADEHNLKLVAASVSLLELGEPLHKHGREGAAGGAPVAAEVEANDLASQGTGAHGVVLSIQNRLWEELVQNGVASLRASKNGSHT